MNRFATISIAVGLGAFANAVIATDYPTKPVRIIVPFAAGAAADAVTRVVAKKLTEYWGKQVILDNRPGVPGIQVAANATPDGYTLLMGAGSSMVTAPLIMSKNIGYDPHKDFAPISRLVTIAPILTTYIKDDTARWVKIVKERKIRIE